MHVYISKVNSRWKKRLRSVECTWNHVLIAVLHKLQFFNNDGENNCGSCVSQWWIVLMDFVCQDLMSTTNGELNIDLHKVTVPGNNLVRNVGGSSNSCLCLPSYHTSATMKTSELIAKRWEHKHITLYNTSKCSCKPWQDNCKKNKGVYL